MTAQPTVILQARFASTRLPGKALIDIAGRTLLGHCLWRLSLEMPVIVATTTQGEDDAIADEARRYGAEVFRGDEHDVLGRFVGAATAFGLVDVVRATADNPVVDVDGPRRVSDLRRRVQVDHVVECGLPIGAAVEAVTAEALARAHGLTGDAYDREHVTPFIRRSPQFTALRAVAPGHLRRPSLRLTVDTPEDLERMRAVLAKFRHVTRPSPLMDIIGAADALAAQWVADRKGA